MENIDTDPARQDIPTVQKVIAVLWPSFVTSGVATVLLFSAFDPQIVMLASGYENISRLGAYSGGFFLLWLLTATTCSLTCYFQRPCHDSRT